MDSRLRGNDSTGVTSVCNVGRRFLREPSSGYCQRDTSAGRSYSANNLTD